MMALTFALSTFLFGMAAGYLLRAVYDHRSQPCPGTDRPADDELFFYDYDIGRTHD